MYTKHKAALINRLGEIEAELPLFSTSYPPFFNHNGKLWGFGVAKLNGDHYFYEVDPATQEQVIGQ